LRSWHFDDGLAIPGSKTDVPGGWPPAGGELFLQPPYYLGCVIDSQGCLSQKGHSLRVLDLKRVNILHRGYYADGFPSLATGAKNRVMVPMTETLRFVEQEGRLIGNWQVLSFSSHRHSLVSARWDSSQPLPRINPWLGKTLPEHRPTESLQSANEYFKRIARMEGGPLSNPPPVRSAAAGR
jgi:hypothetical protein